MEENEADVACVVAIDVDKRQQYVFETDKLREMLGASRIIDGTRDEAEQNFKTEEGLFLFAPVSGEIRVWARKANRDQLLRKAWKLRRYLDEYGVDFSAAYLEVDANHFTEPDGGLASVHKKIHEQLTANKNAKPGSDTNPRCSLFAPCAIHGLEAATYWNPDGDYDEEHRREQVGFRAKSKYDFWHDKRKGFYATLLEKPLLERIRQLDENRYARLKTAGLTFSDLSTADNGTEQRQDQYIAFICADGDNMGKLITALNWNSSQWETNTKPWERNAAFARAVDDCLRQAVAHAIAVAVFPDHESLDRRLKGSEVMLPLLPQLHGGEDVWIVCDRDCALPLATAFEEKYRVLAAKSDVIQRARQVSGETAELTLSLGVAFAKSGYPAHAMIEAAEELLRSAKKRRKGHDPFGRAAGEIGCIDWYWIESSLSEPVNEARAHNLVYLDHDVAMHLTTRPWTANEARRCSQAAVDLQSVARRKREQLEIILRLGHKLSRLAWKSWWLGLSESERDVLREVNEQVGEPLNCPNLTTDPWREFGNEEGERTRTTPWLDLLALQHVLGVEGKQDSGKEVPNDQARD
jgi:hypothetical protein